MHVCYVIVVFCLIALFAVWFIVGFIA
uniref:Uncharacterized protein n=1 Tax=Arundo donax TaxID=35708 RepID=A0A0A9HFV5_ARUDO